MYMRKAFRVHIKADTEAEVKEELRELTYIAIGMREWQKKWEDQYGAVNKAEKKKWEAKLDAWINKHKIIYDAE